MAIVIVVGVSIVCVCMVVWFIMSGISMHRFIGRCLALMSTGTFMTPCEIAFSHAVRYGTLTNLALDTDLIRQVFSGLEEHKTVIGIEKPPDEHCQCDRAYCLSFGTGRRAETSTKRPQLEWIPEGVAKPA